MKIQQIFAASICILLASQQISAVLNNGKKTQEIESLASNTNSESSSSLSSSSTNAEDSQAAASEAKANRREAPILSNSYGVPLAGDSYSGPADSYVPTAPSNPQLPIPIYGVPNGPTNNIIYPAPPPDVPPPAPLVVSSVGLNTVPLETYGPPQPVYIPQIAAVPFDNYIPPAAPSVKYGAPISIPRPQRPFSLPSFHTLKSPKPVYGPPLRPPAASKPLFISKFPKPIYGPPKTQSFKIHHPLPKPTYGVPKIVNTYGPPLDIGSNFNPPVRLNINTNLNTNYGPPNVQYGPPEPVHQHRHGVSAPPTPPDIKYDGWQPIPGLVSRPPADTYAVPQQEHHSSGDLQLNSDFVPPPLGGGQGIDIVSGGVGSVGVHSINHGGVSDSYGAPLNVVTGTDVGITSSGTSHHDDQSSALSIGLSAAGIDNNVQQLSVIKSIGYEIFPGANSAHAGVSSSSHGGGNIGHAADGVHSGSSHTASIAHFGANSNFASGGFDTYSAPPASSYSINGPYAAAHSYRQISQGTKGSFGTHGGSFGSHGGSFVSHGGNFGSHGGTFGSHGNNFGSHGESFGSNGGLRGFSGLSLSPSGIGLIPPSGLYGVPPSGQYGTPLITKPKNLYGPPLNALDINPPKKPVIFREPVPHGLIESIGKVTAQKDAHGIIEHSHHSTGPKYIPPPIPDISKQKLPLPSSIYSLPSTASPISFQSISHGGFGQSISHGGFGGSFSGPSFHTGSGHLSALTSYTAPLNVVGQSYSIPPPTDHLTVGLDNSHPGVTIDLTSNKYGSSFSSFGSSHSFNGGDIGGLATSPGLSHYQTSAHSCNSHKSQPPPSLTYGVPSANSYTASLSSLTTNIGGGYNAPPVPQLYGPPADLHTAHSQKVNTEVSANSIQENSKDSKDSYAKSLGDSLVPGGELVRSQSVDLNNIPLTGNFGTYTLQIQSANSPTRNDGSSEQVPHAQVLNDGLLQSILAAIEQPQQKEMNILGQTIPKYEYTETRSQDYQTSDSEIGTEPEAQQSQKNEVVVPAPVTEISVTNSTSSSIETRTEKRKSISLIDNNEIALYFNGNNGRQNKESSTERNIDEGDTSDVRNGQQYGSFVSFKTPTSSYEYKDVRQSSDSTTDVKN